MCFQKGLVFLYCIQDGFASYRIGCMCLIDCILDFTEKISKIQHETTAITRRFGKSNASDGWCAHLPGKLRIQLELSE